MKTLVVLLLILFVVAACRNETPVQQEPATPTPSRMQALLPTPSRTQSVVPTPSSRPLETRLQGIPTEVEAMPPTMPMTSVAVTATNEIRLSQQERAVSDFLVALRHGLTGAGSAIYLDRDMQAAVEIGRPLPALVGLPDTIPDFTLAVLPTDPLGRSRVRVRFLQEVPYDVIFSLSREGESWQIGSVASHNLVRDANLIDLLAVEDTITAYYRAMAGDQIGEAFTLLTPAAQESSGFDDLSLVAQGLREITIISLQPVQATDEKIVVYARLFAVPDTVQPGVWQLADNARWITLARIDNQWRLAQILDSSLLADVVSWQRVIIPPIEMTFDIPGDWIRFSMAHAVSPNSLGVPAIGVDWVDLSPDSNDTGLLPEQLRGLVTEPVDLDWGLGNQYTFERLAGNGAVVAETHVIVRTELLTYDLYATAASMEQLSDLLPVFWRMVASVAFEAP